MNNVWIITQLHVKAQINSITSSLVVVYKDILYSLYGWDNLDETAVKDIILVNLLGDSYEMEYINMYNEEIAQAAHGYVIKDSLVYLFGGRTQESRLNSLARLDLDNSNLSFDILGRDSDNPSARGGHAMEVYSDELYILGGIDNNGNK